MAQGVALIESLGSEWANVWPPMPSVRLDILAWLFAQLQSLLRAMPMDMRSLTALVHLDTALLRLHQCLDYQVHVPLVALESLRQQSESLMHRLQRNSFSGGAVQLSTRETGPALLVPFVVSAANSLPEVASTKRRINPWLFATVAMIVLLVGVGWRGLNLEGDGVELLAKLFQKEQTMPGPVRLESLFDAGSAELKPGSTKVLISALVDIKAKPGWLIVIAGHTDARGSAEQNLHLSHARAAAVRGWMQRMGDIPDSCFAIQGDASNQPIASNDTESGREANRRVEIHLVPQGGACGQPISSLEEGRHVEQRSFSRTSTQSYRDGSYIHK
jgi:type VI secretion system protein VasL